MYYPADAQRETDPTSPTGSAQNVNLNPSWPTRCSGWRKSPANAIGCMKAARCTPPAKALAGQRERRVERVEHVEDFADRLRAARVPISGNDFETRRFNCVKRRPAAAVDGLAVADLLRRLAIAVVLIRLHGDVVVVAVVVQIDALEGEDRQRRAEHEERRDLDAPRQRGPRRSPKRGGAHRIGPMVRAAHRRTGWSTSWT